METAFGMTIEELSYELMRNPRRQQLLELIYQSELSDEAVEYLEDGFVRDSIYRNDLRRAVEEIYSTRSNYTARKEIRELIKEYRRE